MKTNPTIQLHRHGNNLALAIIGNGETVYLTENCCRELLDNISEAIEDISTRSFTSSLFEPVVINPARTDDQKKAAFLDWFNNYTCTETFAEANGITPDEALALIQEGGKLHYAGIKTLWHVVSVSSNANAFGHKGVIVMNECGEVRELSLQAYGCDKLPAKGDVLTKFPSSEVQPRTLPPASPKYAAKIIKESKI